VTEITRTGDLPFFSRLGEFSRAGWEGAVLGFGLGHGVALRKKRAKGLRAIVPGGRPFLSRINGVKAAHLAGRRFAQTTPQVSRQAAENPSTPVPTGRTALTTQADAERRC
jgi:hypothetical protein